MLMDINVFVMFMEKSRNVKHKKQPFEYIEMDDCDCHVIVMNCLMLLALKLDQLTMLIMYMRDSLTEAERLNSGMKPLLCHNKDLWHV